AAQNVTLPEYHYVELDNGAVFILHEKRDVPLIGVRVLISGGATTDPDGKAGLASLFATMLEKGAGERDAIEFAETVAASGGSLSANAGLESISISAEFLARDADLVLELLVDMLRAPALDRSEFTKLRDRQIDLLRAAKDSDLRALTSIYGNAYLFGDHPYGTPVDGNEASLAAISHRDLLAYYDDSIGADRLIISLAGDFDAADIVNKLTAAFDDWRPAAQALAEIEAPVPEVGRRVLLVDKPGATQSYFWIGNVGVSKHYPQRAELNIANTLFGGRFTSMLVDEMRTKAGLTYGVRSSLLRPSQPGSFAIVSYTKTDTTVVAIDLAIELLARLRNDGFDDELITSGKNYILGQFPPRLETAEQLANQFAALQAAGLDESFINDYGAAVAGAASEDIQSVIESVYPQVDNLVFVIIGDAEQIRDVVAKYGPVTEMPITDPRFRP
ncbi:MAG: M16 family metallopeptidase, partial [Alphaproteobacteria bacterium]